MEITQHVLYFHIFCDFGCLCVGVLFSLGFWCPGARLLWSNWCWNW